MYLKSQKRDKPIWSARKGNGLLSRRLLDSKLVIDTTNQGGKKAIQLISGWQRFVFKCMQMYETEINLAK